MTLGYPIHCCSAREGKGASRRAFLKTLVRGGLGAAALSPAFRVLAEAEAAWAAQEAHPMKEVAFYAKLSDNHVQCQVCPNACILGEGETGRCRARTNHGGTHYNHAYGNPCILSVDPIEKLPMNHFLPGSETVCIAVGGCNLRCLYCQNWEWSQKKPEEIEHTFSLGPGEAVHAVLKKEIRTIAFTYTDPIAFFEYVCDIADVARNSGVRCVAATNAFGTKATIQRAAEKLDAVTVGLKGFDEDFYRKVCGASLKPVLDALVEFKASGKCWLEITTLLVPTYNDDMKKIKAMARWIRKNLGTRVPWHLARFVPRYKLVNVPRTPVTTLDEGLDIALDEGLEYVYTSNIAPHKGNNTFCPRCGKPVIQRVGFKILKDETTGGRCRCGHTIPGVFPSPDPR